MAVFWFGWAKKLKNIFTKQQADQYYLQKNSNQLQTVAGQTVFSKTGEVIKIDSNSDTATFLSGYKSNNERIWFFGKGSSTSNNFVIGADKSDIKLEPRGKVDLSNKKISWLADPTADQDAANKRYVDNAINSIQVGGSIKVGNTIFQTEMKNIQGGNVLTIYSPASGFSITNLVVKKLYFVEVYYKTGTTDIAPIFYLGSSLVSMYLPRIATTILFGNHLNQSLEVFADKPVSNLSISFKEVIITQ